MCHADIAPSAPALESVAVKITPTQALNRTKKLLSPAARRTRLAAMRARVKGAMPSRQRTATMVWPWAWLGPERVTRRCKSG